MTLELRSDTLPLAMDNTGTVRVSGTRISLDVLLGFYNQGQTAEELARGFPSLPLADIHAVIAFYLRHREAVEAYLAQREQEAEELRRKIESDPKNRAMREKILARARERGFRK